MNIGLLVDDIVGVEIAYNIIRTQNDDQAITYIILHENIPDMLKNTIQQMCDFRSIPLLQTSETGMIRGIVEHYDTDLLCLLHWPDRLSKDIVNATKHEVVATQPSNLHYSEHINPYSKAILEEYNKFYAQIVSLKTNTISFEKEIKLDIHQTYSTVKELYKNFAINLFNDSYKEIKTLSKGIRELNKHPKFSTKMSNELDLNENMPVSNILKKIRAYSGSHGNQIYYDHDGKRYFVNITIDKA